MIVEELDSSLIGGGGDLTMQIPFVSGPQNILFSSGANKLCNGIIIHFTSARHSLIQLSSKFKQNEIHFKLYIIPTNICSKVLFFELPC